MERVGLEGCPRILNTKLIHAKPNIPQWTLSNPVTLGTSQSVLIGGVTSFQGTRKHSLNNTRVASFQES